MDTNGSGFPVLRAATNDDGARVAELVFAVLAEYGLAPDPDTTDADLRDIEQAYITNGGAFDVLADETGAIIGCVGLYRIDHAVCELRKMYLDRAYRGRGLGKRLMEHAMDQARQLGFRRVILESASVLHEAIAMYINYGFRRYECDHLSQRCDQAYSLPVF